MLHCISVSEKHVSVFGGRVHCTTAFLPDACGIARGEWKLSAVRSTNGLYTSAVPPWPGTSLENTCLKKWTNDHTSTWEVMAPVTAEDDLVQHVNQAQRQMRLQR